MKDANIHIRISTTEKNKFLELAKAEGLDLSGFFMTAAREKAYRKDYPAAAADNSVLIKRIDQLEKMVLQSNQGIISILEEKTQEEKEDLLLYAAMEKIYWILQQKQYQRDTREELKLLLQQLDPKVSEYLEETPRRLFSALDLALEKLEGEGKIRIGRKNITWL